MKMIKTFKGNIISYRVQYPKGFMFFVVVVWVGREYIMLSSSHLFLQQVVLNGSKKLTYLLKSLSILGF